METPKRSQQLLTLLKHSELSYAERINMTADLIDAILKEKRKERKANENIS